MINPEILKHILTEHFSVYGYSCNGLNYLNRYYSLSFSREGEAITVTVNDSGIGAVGLKPSAEEGIPPAVKIVLLPFGVINKIQELIQDRYTGEEYIKNTPLFSGEL